MNPLSSKSDAQLRAEKAAILRELSARRKARKPKVRKVRRIDPEADDQRRAWNAMLRNATNCEACGRTRRDKPEWFPVGDFYLDRAHIIGGTGKRTNDRRLCVILCRACHHQQTIGEQIVGCLLEPLTLANLLWIKSRQPDYDPVFIRRHSNKPLPLPVAPPDLYWRSMYQFCGKRRDDEALALTKGEGR